MEQQPAVTPNVPPEFPSGASFLIADAVSLVVACMSGAEVPEDDLAPLIRNVHSVLLDVARDADALTRKEPSAGVVSRTAGSRELPGQGLPVPELPEIDALAEHDANAAVAAAEVLGGPGASFPGVRVVPVLPMPSPAPLPATPPVARKTARASARPSKQEQPASASAPKARPAAPPSSSGVSGTAPLPVSSVVPLQGSLAFERAAAAVPVEEAVKAAPAALAPVRRARAKPTRPSRTKRLPKGLASIEDALKMDIIVCLEDGKRVRDLSAHLKAIGMTANAYRRKWGLPPEYPMQAPQTIMKRGATFEVDLATGRRIPVR